MPYIPNNDSESLIGQYVTLTKVKSSSKGKFTPGSLVKITAMDDARGYTFEDEFGNRVIEAGFDGFVTHDKIKLYD